MILPIADIPTEDIRFLFSSDTRIANELAAANRSLDRLGEAVDDLWPPDGDAALQAEGVTL